MAVCSVPVIQASDLSFQFSNGHALWPAISLSLDHQATGLVGRNGIGKSILAQLLAKQLAPSSGSVFHHGRVSYLAQANQDQQLTLGQLLGVDRAVAAYQRILQGSAAQADFDAVGDQWDLPEQLSQLQDTTACSSLDWHTPLARLSGGQQMRLRLLGALRQMPDYLILDEPSNHLDQSARRWLKDQLAALDCGVLVISHDRDLLNQMEATLELTSLGLSRYGGGFDHYYQQKQGELSAGDRRLHQAKQAVKLQKQKQQERLEKEQQKHARGRAKIAAGGITRFKKAEMVERGEKTRTRNIQLEQDREFKAQQTLAEVQQSMEWVKPIGLSLANTRVARSKRMVELTALQVGFDQALTSPVEQSVFGPARIWLQGDNGSGKSTLLKTLAGLIPPLGGDYQLGTDFAYLDQQLAFLDDSSSAADNFQRLAPGMTVAEYRTRLAWLRLRRDKADIPVGNLSGGERLKVALACALLGPHPTQLLLLDEPNNHLDLESLLALESALKAYQGTFILVSHDATLARNIGVDCCWRLQEGSLQSVDADRALTGTPAAHSSSLH